MDMQRAEKIIYDYLSAHEEPSKADVVIAFGSYLEATARTAAQLVLDGFAPLMVCTGATTPLTEHLPGGSEALYFAQIAREMGVAEKAILIEPLATNTGDNIINSFRLLREHGIEPKTVLTCSMPPHQRRIIHTMAKREPQVRVIPIDVPFSKEDYRTREGLAYSLRLTAELERLRVYPERGFTTPAAIPEEVLEAERLIRTQLKIPAS